MLVQGLADEDGAIAKTVSDFFHDPRRGGASQRGDSTPEVVVDIFEKMLLGPMSSASKGLSTWEAEEVNKTSENPCQF